MKVWGYAFEAQGKQSGSISVVVSAGYEYAKIEYSPKGVDNKSVVLYEGHRVGLDLMGFGGGLLRYR